MDLGYSRSKCCYEIAKALVSLGYDDDAIAELKNAANHGFKFDMRLRSDPWLKSLASHPDFEELFT